MDDMNPQMIETDAGDKVWFTHSSRIHRIDGPAIEYVDGRKSWYLDNDKLTLDEWLTKNHGLTEEEKVMMKLQYG
jgi:hypothetical protein